MSWRSELFTECQYKPARGITRPLAGTSCAEPAVTRVVTPGGSWWLCEYHAYHGKLTPAEREEALRRLRI